ncbi:unnamed protein product, partial [Closterium sp. NIES-54]
MTIYQNRAASRRVALGKSVWISAVTTASRSADASMDTSGSLDLVLNRAASRRVALGRSVWKATTASRSADASMDTLGSRDLVL